MSNSPDRLVVSAGTLLFSEGEVGGYAYLIVSGRIEIFLDRGGIDLILVTRGPGEVVGEMAIIDRGPRSASARVVEDCELSLISEDQVSHRMGNTDPILRMCLGVVLDRYRETVAMLDHGTTRRVAEARPSVSPNDFTAALKTLSLENDLRRGLAAGEFEIYFQPIVRLPDRELAGFEALLRWTHPEWGLISPAVFIPLAEASGLICDLTAFVIGEVGRLFPLVLHAVADNPRVKGALFVSLNISGHDLGQTGFVDGIATMLRQSGLLAGSIKLEVTESMLMKEPQKAAAALAECRRLGCRVAIDDFGTGYSSLSHLTTLPITTIKIDQSFVRSMIEDATSRKIIHTILRLADELDFPVIAEGIEGEREAAALGQLGCSLGQGYLFGHPQPLAPTLALARAWSPLRTEPKGNPGLLAVARRA